MIQFVCDTCSAVKGSSDVWILGLAAESLGLSAARREVSILPVWDRPRAVHPLAVHFCSVECKDKYMAALFGPETPEEQVIIERGTPAAAETVMERTSVTPAVRTRAARTSRRAGTRASGKSREKKKVA